MTQGPLGTLALKWWHPPARPKTKSLRGTGCNASDLMVGFEKHCVSRGCKKDACFGYGSLRRDKVKFACAEHRALIWPEVAIAAAQKSRWGAAASTSSRSLPVGPSSAAQGSLW